MNVEYVNFEVILIDKAKSAIIKASNYLCDDVPSELSEKFCELFEYSVSDDKAKC